MRVVPEDEGVAVVNGGLEIGDRVMGTLVLRIPAEKTPVNFDVRIARKGVSPELLGAVPHLKPKTYDHSPLAVPANGNNAQQTIPEIGKDDGPFAVDTLTRPTD